MLNCQKTLISSIYTKTVINNFWDIWQNMFRTLNVVGSILTIVDKKKVRVKYFFGNYISSKSVIHASVRFPCKWKMKEMIFLSMVVILNNRIWQEKTESNWKQSVARIMKLGYHSTTAVYIESRRIIPSSDDVRVPSRISQIVKLTFSRAILPETTTKLSRVIASNNLLNNNS